MADAPPPGKGGTPPAGGAPPAAKPPGGGQPPSAATAAAQPNMQQIFMLAGRGMTPQMQQLFQNFRPPPMPPELAEAFKKMQPQLEAARAAVLKPEVAAEMKRYQAAVAKLNPTAPDFATQLEKIPKPNLQSLRLPEPSPEIKRMIQQWLLSAKSPQITAALGQAAQAAQQAQQAQQVTKPAPKQAPKQQQQQQAAAKPAKQQQVAPKQQQQASKAAAAKPPALPTKQPSPAPQPVIPQRARPRKPSPLGPLGAKPAGPVTATPAAAAAGAGAGSAQATPVGAAAKSGASSEDHEGPEATGIEVEVVCNGLKGTFLVDQQLMVCYCAACEERAEREGRRRSIVSPSEFERHAGAGQAKKWRWTVHTADDKQTLGDWLATNKLDTRSKLGRSPFSTKQRKQAAEAADAEAEGREESEGPRLLLSGRSLPARRGRGKRKKSEEPDTDEDEELKAALEGLSDDEGEQESRPPQRPRRDTSEPPGAGRPTDAQQAQQAQQAQRMEGVEQAEQAQQAQQAVSPLAPRPGGSGEHGGGGQPGQLQPSGGSGKHKRQLRWIRRSTASPEGSDDEAEGRGGKRQQQQPQQPQPQPQVKQEADSDEEPAGPLLLPMQKAAAAAEAAAARQAGVGASAVGPRPLGLAPLAVPKKGGKGGRGGGEEPPGLRSPTGKPWLAADHAFHEEHEGTDMRLGEAFQAHLPFYGPLEMLGEAAEAQEPLAALPGPSEAEALVSAAGPERLQALSLPRDATADVWLREVADQVRATITGRQQRQRKQSRWLQETFDPNAVLGGKPLVERQFEEDNARDRFMLGRSGQRGGLLGELEAAAAAGAQPELLRWTVERMGESGAGLGVRLTLGGVLFGGILAPLGGTASGGVTPSHRPLSALLGDAATAAAAGGAAEVAARGLQPAVSGISMEQPAGSRRAGQGGTPAATGALSLAATGGRGGGAAVPASQWHEGESRHDAGAERRQQAEARFQALEVAGAPPGTKCALCHGTEVDDIDESTRGLGGRTPAGLGQMILVRVSAVSHAWVHDQCARWSPEVYDPEGTGHLEGVRDAVRRGRMLRCKYCGDKGATLGCFKLTCRASYHLACARKYRCLLQVEPYVVACPEHVNDLPAPYGNKPPKSRSGKRKPGAPRGGKGRTGGGGAAAAGGGRGRGGRGSRGSDSEEEEAVLEGMEESEDEDEEMQDDEAEEGSQGGTEQLTAAGEESDSAAALLTQLHSLAQPKDNGAAGRKAAATAARPAAAAALPLPIPVVPGAAAAGAWTRERIVERHNLRSELAAEQAHGTKVVVVNFEDTHFRFRSFHAADDITEAVQADADAILVLDRSLVPASQRWLHAHSFPAQTPADQLTSFCNLLLKEGWKRLPADEQQRQLKQTTEQAVRQQQEKQQPAAPAAGVALPTGVNPAAVAAGLAQALANPAGRAAIAARLAELAPAMAARPAAAAPAAAPAPTPAVATAALSQLAPALLSSLLQQRGQPSAQGQQQQQQQQQPGA